MDVGVAVIVFGVAWLLVIMPFLIRACRDIAASPPSPAYRKRGFWSAFQGSGAFGGFGGSCGGTGCGGGGGGC